MPLPYFQCQERKGSKEQRREDGCWSKRSLDWSRHSSGVNVSHDEGPPFRNKSSSALTHCRLGNVCRGRLLPKHRARYRSGTCRTPRRRSFWLGILLLEESYGCFYFVTSSNLHLEMQRLWVNINIEINSSRPRYIHENGIQVTKKTKGRSNLRHRKCQTPRYRMKEDIPLYESRAILLYQLHTTTALHYSPLALHWAWCYYSDWNLSAAVECPGRLGSFCVVSRWDSTYVSKQWGLGR